MITLTLIAAAAAAAVCPAPQGWAKPVRHIAAKSPEMKFALPANGSSQLTLLPLRSVKLSGGHKPKAGTSAGLAAIDVPKAGKLDVVLSTATWVDMIRDGKAVPSSAHAMTTGCVGIRKSVTFDVTPGRYVIQLTDGPDKSVRMGTVLR